MSEQAKAAKAEVIAGLAQALTKSTVGILTDYRGMDTASVTALRRKLQDAGGEYRVIKNTLTRFAAEKTNKSELSRYLEGPTAIALGYGDATAMAKIVTDYLRDSKTTLKIKGGFLGDRIITAEDVTTLATLPPREVLVARVLGQMTAPVAILLGTLAAPVSGLMRVLQGRIDQMEKEKK